MRRLPVQRSRQITLQSAMPTLLVSALALTAPTVCLSHHRCPLVLNTMQSAATVVAAVLIATPSVGHAAIEANFDMEACTKSPSICLVMRDSATAAARNEARLARVAQCDLEMEQVKKNNNVLPANVNPATDQRNNPNMPATCVGAPTYQLKGPGDPSLPQIYPNR